MRRRNFLYGLAAVLLRPFAAVARPKKQPPQNLSPPVISNTSHPVTSAYPQSQTPIITDTTLANSWAVGDILSTTNGTWSGSPTRFTYQWQNNPGGIWTSIGSANSQTYTVQAGDLGDMIRVIVTAANASGATSAASAQVGPMVSQLVYWGALIGPQYTGTQAPGGWGSSPNSGTDFEADVASGKGMSICHFGRGTFQNGDGSYNGFPTTSAGLCRSAGVIPFIDLGTITAVSANLSQFTNTAIAGGSQDVQLTNWANAAAAWGHPFFLRLDWEMSGSWFQWGTGNNGNVDADFAPMWRHVHDLFISAGATNVSWHWCPNWDCSNARSAVLYPGDAYVDWVGSDGYNNGGQTFSSIFSPTHTYYSQTLAPSKPYMIGETGCTEAGFPFGGLADKAAWITDAFAQLSGSLSGIRALVWYERNDGTPADGWLESSTASKTAFRAGIANSRYVSNVYASLTPPIP